MSLRVRTEILPSPIHGRGLFALEPIAAGTVVWKYDPAVDRIEIEPDPNGYSWRVFSGHVVPGDAACFINHSSTPNLSTTPGLSPCVAARDIAAGEEITEDYSYDPDWGGT